MCVYRSCGYEFADYENAVVTSFLNEGNDTKNPPIHDQYATFTRHGAELVGVYVQL